MLESEGNSVEIALNELIAHAQNYPAHEPIIRKSLDSLRRAFMNSALINDISKQRQPNIPDIPEISKKNDKKESNQSKHAEAKEFSNKITRQCDITLRLTDLNKIISIIGPKHGMYPNRNEKRDKTELLLWLKERFDILQEDFYLNIPAIIEHQ